MTNQSNKRSDQIADDQAMINGIQKFLSPTVVLSVGSQANLTPADIVKVFQGRLTAGQAVVTAEATRTAAVKGNLDERSKTAAFVQAFRRIVVGMFQESPDTLAVFNLAAPKAATKTVATKATAVAKSKATRVARNTLGSKQKSKIKGTVPVASTEPAQTPAASTAPAPAASTAPATAPTPPPLVPAPKPTT
jgi:hypothetical protein